MKKKLSYYLLLVLISTLGVPAFSQKTDFDELARIPKTAVNFPLDYKILRPRLKVPFWDDDYDRFYAYLTPAVRRTQAALSSTINGVVSTLTPNSIMPHAQLDTNTIIGNNSQVAGTWRMLAYRSIRFNDSVDINTKIYYRLADTLLHDKSRDEVFAVITDDNFKLYAREDGKTKFKNVISSKYQIEGKRFLMLYKFAKAAAGVSQLGIDEKGYLILNYPQVIENVKKGEYFSYYTIIEQYIFEKVK